MMTKRSTATAMYCLCLESEPPDKLSPPLLLWLEDEEEGGGQTAVSVVFGSSLARAKINKQDKRKELYLIKTMDSQDNSRKFKSKE